MKKNVLNSAVDKKLKSQKNKYSSNSFIKTVDSFFEKLLNKKYIYLIIVGLSLLLYINTLSFDFVYMDDDSFILGNWDKISKIENTGLIFTSNISFRQGDTYYRPLHNMNYMLAAIIGGKNASIFHLISIFLHGIIACIIFKLLIVFNVKKRLSFIFTIFFIIHPLFVSSIAWLSASLLFPLFVFSSLLTFILGFQRKKNIYFIVHTILFLCAMLSYEAAIIFPIIFTLYYFLFINKNIFTKKNIMILGLWILVLVIWYILRNNAIGGASVSGGLSNSNFLTNIRAIFEIFFKFCFPFFLTPQPIYSIYATLTGALLLGTLFTYSLFKLKDKSIKYLFFGFTFFLLPLIPPLFVSYTSSGIYADYFESRAYLLSFGFILIVYWIINNINFHLSYKWKIILIAPFIILLSVYNITYNKVYSSAINYYNEVINYNPQNPSAYYNLAGYYQNIRNDLIKAEKLYAKAIEAKPDKYDAWFNRGATLEKLGKNEEAIKCYDEVIRIKPDYYGAWYNKGFTLGKIGKNEEAVKCYDEAIKLNSDNPDAWTNKGIAFSHMNKYYEAIECYDKAINFNKNDDAAWNNKGNAFFHLQKYEEAITYYDKALELKPDNYDTWNNKGGALISLGRYDEAIKCYDKALEIKPDLPDAMKNKKFAQANLKK
jgi:tetratricopeptide (TPR) repeat protein